MQQHALHSAVRYAVVGRVQGIRLRVMCTLVMCGTSWWLVGWRATTALWASGCA
jgi:hypothetical protein